MISGWTYCETFGEVCCDIPCDLTWWLLPHRFPPWALFYYPGDTPRVLSTANVPKIDILIYLIDRPTHCFVFVCISMCICLHQYVSQKPATILLKELFLFEQISLIWVVRQNLNSYIVGQQQVTIIIWDQHNFFDIVALTRFQSFWASEVTIRQELLTR